MQGRIGPRERRADLSPPASLCHIRSGRQAEGAVVAVYLDEEMVGTHPNEICFPHLLLCAGVVCQLGNGTLVGGHISGPESEGAVLDRMVTHMGGGGGIARVYIITDFPVHYGYAHMRLADKARRLGFVGNALVLDTHAIVNTVAIADGAYARVESLGAGNGCQVFALPDIQARPYVLTAFNAIAAGGVIEKVRAAHGDARPPYVVKSTDAAPRPGAPVAVGQFKIARVN